MHDAKGYSGSFTGSFNRGATVDASIAEGVSWLHRCLQSATRYPDVRRGSGGYGSPEYEYELDGVRYPTPSSEGVGLRRLPNGLRYLVRQNALL
jgi:hypothetical protein